MSAPNITTIYLAGILFPTVSTTGYDPTQQVKPWIRPLQPGEDPTDDFPFQTAEVDNTVPPPYVTWHQKGMSKGAAAIANAIPSNYTPPVGVVQVTGEVPIPMDPTLVPAGYTLTGTPLGLALVANTPTPTPDTTETRILEGVEEIEKADNLPII